MTLSQENTPRISIESIVTYCQEKWHLANQNTVEHTSIAVIYSVALKLFSAIFIYGFPGVGTYVGYPLFVASLAFDALLLLNIPAIVHKYFGYLDPRPAIQAVNTKVVQPIKQKTVEIACEVKESEVGQDFCDDMRCVKALLFGWVQPRNNNAQQPIIVKNQTT